MAIASSSTLIVLDTIRVGRSTSPVTIRCIVSKSAIGAGAAMLRRDLVEDDAEREHVAAAIDIAATALLGRHVRELA